MDAVKTVADERKLLAYNLSAQIIFSYLNGYSCQAVKSVNVSHFSGITAIDYKNDAVIIELLLKGAELEFFAELNKPIKIQAIEAAEKLARIIIAGTAAETIYENGGYIDETINIKLHFLDLMKVQYINYILTHTDPHHHPDFIKNTIDEVLMYMAKPEVWKNIEELAGNIIKKQFNLNQAEINKIIQNK